jgi:predicted ribosome quality control (RQC) complex YloA/Tae2 family protein
MIVRRLAAELDRTLRGARVRAAGRLADGRFGLRVPHGIVVIDAFGPTPIVALENEAELDRSSGWIRAMASALEGLRIDRIRARRGDRLIAFECSSRSRFGVESGYRLVAELVPRFGNIVLLKDDTVVSAAKEFTHSDNSRRTTLVGDPYEPPPLPAGPPDGESLSETLEALERSDDSAARERASRALRSTVPLLPKLLADGAIAETALARGAGPRALAERCVERARALVAATNGEPAALGDVFVYRDGGTLVQCHVVPLAQYAALDLVRVSAIVPVLAEVVGDATRARAAQAFDSKRAALRARLDKRRAALAAERATLERERDDATSREALRTAGTLLYAHLSDVPPRARSFVPPSDPSVTIALDPELDPKANAAVIFKRYRKAVAKLDHAGKRLDELERDARFAENVAWELERATPDTLGEAVESLERLERRPQQRGPAAGRPKAPASSRRGARPLDFRLARDARLYVGRSPAGNADLTFRVAAPDDLWFHARETPGAHVVLHFDAPREPTSDELSAAAALAAFHSKAGASEKVAVDYTERKHVRKQQNAPPGLVWYTNARTLLVKPRDGVPVEAAS